MAFADYFVLCVCMCVQLSYLQPFWWYCGHFVQLLRLFIVVELEVQTGTGVICAVLNILPAAI